MIDRLEGNLISKTPTSAILAVGPLYLEIQIPLSTSQKLPASGSRAEFWTHLQWKEDGPALFGFGDREEREIFRLLLLVQGVGPRLALSVLSHMPPRELISQIRNRSVEGLTRVPGIGAKTAGRMLVELGPRFDRLGPDSGIPGPAGGGPSGAPQEEDAVQALTALGYASREARRSVQETLREAPELPLDDCIRRALKRLAAGRG